MTRRQLSSREMESIPNMERMKVKTPPLLIDDVEPVPSISGNLLPRILPRGAGIGEIDEFGQAEVAVGGTEALPEEVSYHVDNGVYVLIILIPRS